MGEISLPSENGGEYQGLYLALSSHVDATDVARPQTTVNSQASNNFVQTKLSWLVSK